jgi:hypothetical protein
MPTPGVPHELDDESLRRIARTFYVVKLARYAALLVAALGIAALAAAEDAPGWVPVTMLVLAVAFVAAMARARARYVSSQRPTSPGPASRSPRG